jgi:glycosyltransferase involved in cell wall biosynthesis
LSPFPTQSSLRTALYDGIKLTKYSVCMTCFNEVGTVRESLNSLLGQLNEKYEVIVVDNFSVDGTYEVLREFERTHGVKVIQRRCSRGLGRQIAFENASGDYIIGNLDLDDIFMPAMDKLTTLYHEKAEGYLMAIFNFIPSPGTFAGWAQNITIGPNELIASLGGWRDLNVFEDWDIWSRAAKVHKYCWTSLRYTMNDPSDPGQKRAVVRMSNRYERYRDRLRLGMRIFYPGEEVGMPQRIAYTAARLSLLFQRGLVGQDPDFNSLDPSFFIEFPTTKIPGANKTT